MEIDEIEGLREGQEQGGLGAAEAQGVPLADAPAPDAPEFDAPAAEASAVVRRGQVVKLDRGFPLVRLDDGELVRCEHATELEKTSRKRAVVGDYVGVLAPEGHDKGVIESIEPRSRELIRKDPAERVQPQVLAANFDRVFVAQPLAEVNVRRLERELVLAYETGAAVTVVLTKADLAESEDQVAEVAERVRALVGSDVKTLVVSANDPDSIEEVRALVPAGTTAVLIGKSGVGKSSLVNMLVGYEMQATTPVREGDGKGRHTTVSREMIEVPGGGFIVDMPGVRGLGLWDADEGIDAAFSDIEELAEQCRFRDCRHIDEPGCAVRAAVESGELARERYESYQALKKESAQVAERREEARRLRGEKASDRSKPVYKQGRGRPRR